MQARASFVPRNRVRRVLVVLAQPLVELATLHIRDCQLGSGLGILDDAVPELLDERQPRLDVQRKKLFQARSCHDVTLPRTEADAGWAERDEIRWESLVALCVNW